MLHVLHQIFVQILSVLLTRLSILPSVMSEIAEIIFSLSVKST